jgi:hypothetical protein
MKRTVRQFRLIWKRVGRAEKRKLYWSERAVQRRITDDLYVACDHAFIACWDKGCQHAVPHKAGQVADLNGLNMGDCTDERNECMCSVATGTLERIRCVPVMKQSQAKRPNTVIVGTP